MNPSVTSILSWSLSMRPVTLLRSAGVLALALASTACASVSDMLDPGTVNPAHTGSGLTPTEQFGISVAEQPDRIQLLPRPGALSPSQVQALSELARRWREGGRGVVRIETPAGGQNAAVASQAAFAAAQVLQGAGVPASALVQTAYNATGQAAPTVAVGFSRYVASVPDCSTFQSDVTKTRTNEPTGAFGCATTANFAAQIADPGDLLAPKPEGAPDTARRAFVLDGYRQGKPTGTPRSTNPSESQTAADR